MHEIEFISNQGIDFFRMSQVDDAFDVVETEVNRDLRNPAMSSVILFSKEWVARSADLFYSFCNL